MWTIYWFLRILLFFGLDDFVYDLSYRWGRTMYHRRYNAAWQVQKDLVAGKFLNCPSCGWAVRTVDEHILRGYDSCYDKYNGDILV